MEDLSARAYLCHPNKEMKKKIQRKNAFVDKKQYDNIDKWVIDFWLIDYKKQ